MITVADRMRIEIADPYDMKYSGVGIVSDVCDDEIFVDLCGCISYRGGFISTVSLKPRLDGDKIQEASKRVLFVNGKGQIEPSNLGQYKGYIFFIATVLKEIFE